MAKAAFWRMRETILISVWSSALSPPYDSAAARTQRDLAVAEGQLRDYQARLGTAFPHEGYLSELTALRDQLKAGLTGMRAKLEELHIKRDELAARAKMAEAQRQVQESVQSISSYDPTSELSRYEDQVRREEAMARGTAEVAADTLDNQFKELEDADANAEVEARLASLKSGGTPAA